MILTDNKGFTLVEVMITIVILLVGILAMSMMQIQAINGNSTAFSRTSANTIATAFLEELKRLPFDDANLTAGANLDAGVAPPGGNPTPANADHSIPVNLPALSNTYIVSNNELIDSLGNRFQLFWNVQTTSIQVGTSNYTPFCTIRLFMYWDAPMGVNSLSMTTIKFNNT